MESNIQEPTDASNINFVAHPRETSEKQMRRKYFSISKKYFFIHGFMETAVSLIINTNNSYFFAFYVFFARHVHFSIL